MNNEDVKVNIVLGVNDVNVILSALREMPYRLVSDLVNNIVNQAQEQLQPKSEEPKQ